jgi:hypothetical protein
VGEPVILAAAALSFMLADPCGMVWPIVQGPQIPVTRVGAQRTYVFYEKGVETYVIRPGFRGNVDEFGMLIPFPSAPALRKVPDETFANIASAIDPPEVVIDLRPRPRPMGGGGGCPLCPTVARGPSEEPPLVYNQVKVLHEEAVGMYEVVVLAAGSADALSKWMDEHGFRYPAGMDSVVNEYVKARWVFVAEKTKVGSKPDSDPKPGMKKVDPSIPVGSTFDGYVQAMGFRFKVDKPVVPMRLSPFNEGDKRQIVYYLTTEPVALDGIPEKMVVRQVTGNELLHNLTSPLPIRLYGGTAAALQQNQVLGRANRDPKPFNAIAKDLFASDLLAVQTGQLSLPHEEKEKELLRIGEALSIRGPEIDSLHEAELETERDATARDALRDVKGLTMTVVDGEFPIDYMKAHDLTFHRWSMDSKRNDRNDYDAKLDGPSPEPGGLRLEGDPPR